MRCAILLLLFFSGCAFSAQIGTTTAIDDQARHQIAQANETILSVAKKIDSVIDSRLEEFRKEIAAVKDKKPAKVATPDKPSTPGLK